MTDVPERHRMILALFQTSQCSWCRKFYTNEPFLCPFGQLQSNCASFDKLSEIEGWWWREYKGEKHLPRIADMIRQVEDKGIMAKCRDSKCGALNPNPQKSTCWVCGKQTLCCPQHPSLILRYNIKEDFWKCSLASHNQKFYKVIEATLTDKPCPKCSPYSPYLNLAQNPPEKQKLYYDAELSLFKCKKCNRLFTYDKGKLREIKIKR